MSYAKLLLPTGPQYAAVELRQDVLWATHPIPGPEEDPTPNQATFPPAPLDTFTLLPPVRPSKIVCIGRNYRDHAAELGNDLPKEPLLFLKPPSSLLAPGAPIVLPPQSSRVDFEGELALVIGRRCSHLQPGADVRPYLRGYTLINDVTARDLQKSDPQWTRGKGFDTFCPCGPIVSDLAGTGLDPIAGPPVTLTTHLNGDLRQHGSTADLIFTIPQLLVYITACMTLEPGDLIPTGTPAGVSPMHAGDTVSVSIPGLGTLTNPVV